MITKRSKVYVRYLYMRIKVRKYTCLRQKQQTGRCLNHNIKRNPSLQIFFQKIKRPKTNREGWEKRRKSIKSYNHNKICFLFPCLFIFHQINLLNLQMKFVFCFHLLICPYIVCYNHSTKETWVLIKYSIVVI